MVFPLFIVTGISGSGKSTAAIELGKIMPDYNVFDMDLIVHNDDYQTACCNWLKIAYTTALNGRSTILFGNVSHPYDIQSCELFPAFSPIRFIHLHCHKEERLKRLEARKVWTQETLEEAIELSEEMLEKASAADPPIPVINTSITPVHEVAEEIKRWVLSF